MTVNVNTQYIGEIKVDSNGDWVIDLPPALVSELGWETGDIFDIVPHEESGGFTLKKVAEAFEN